MSKPEVDITPEEFKRFEEAMKKEEFRKLFQEYAEEISDPENRKKYEEEIRQLECEKGMDIKFITPKPGHVLKSVLNNNEGDKKRKVFINICTNENVEKATSTSVTRNGPHGRGVNWSVPHSMTKPRDDLDKSGEKCSVYDVVFHPDTYKMSQSDPRFKNLIHETAIDAIQEHFNVSLDKKNIKTPRLKNNYKGVITSTVVRTRRADPAGSSEASSVLPPDSILNQMPYPYDSNKTTQEMTNEWLEKEGRRKPSKRLAERSQSNVTSAKISSTRVTPPPSSSSSSSSLKEDASTTPSTKSSCSSLKEEQDKPIIPKYSILHRSAIDLQDFRNTPDAKTSTRPKELVVSIDLPKLNSANTVDLDIVENYIMLKCTTPASYELELRLPYPVDETNGTAKFDKSKSQLNITLPVLVAQPEPFIFGSTHEAEEDASSDVDSEKAASLDEGSEVSYDSPSPGVDKEDDCEDLNSDDVVMKAPTNFNSCGMLVSSALCQLPPFVFSQDNETITFVIDVVNVNRNRMVKKYDNSNTYDLVFVSEGSGCFPIHYRLYVQFPEGCNISLGEDALDCSEENLVVLLHKDEKCQELWDGFLVGSDEDNLEPYHFESLSKLEKTLQDLDACCDPLCNSNCDSAMPQAHDSTDYHLHVTELDEKHVTLDVQVTRGVSESDTTDTESHAYPTIEVIHRKQTPDLHGILKQRSRTISDSSDENGTVLSASPDSSSHEGHFPSVKKSVSFNERIDQTTFKTNSTVSSMHNALKSKRKRTRQREERRKNGRRRRRHSSQESSEGEEGHLKDKNDAPITKGSHQGGQQHGKTSRKETRAAAAAFNKNASKHDGTGSSSTVDETDETTNTEGSGHDTDSGCDNNDNNSKNSSKPESSSHSEDNNVDHYNLRPRGNRSSKSEPKNCYSTKNCSHNSIVVSGERMDNELTPEERTKLDRLMTAALNQTLSQMKPNLNDNSEHFELVESLETDVVESLETDVVEPSKTQVTDTLTHMASLSIGDGVKAPTEKEHVVSNMAVRNGQLVDGDNNTPPVVNNEDDGKSVVRVGDEAEKSRVKYPKDCNTKLKNDNAVNGKKCQKSELDNFRSMPKIESTLSWTDTEYTKQQLSNEHHTECAFHFNNNVMFELD